MTWTPTTGRSGTGVPGRPGSLAEDLARTTAVRQLIEELLADPRQLGPDYQPVCRLADGTMVAVKATGRGRPGTELADTLALLEGAQSLGLVERLDWAFRCLAFEDLLADPRYELQLTPEPETFGTMCPPRLAAIWARARRQLRVAAELHADAFTDPDRLRRGVEDIRSWGWRLIVADPGDDRAAWDLAAQVRPDVVQVDLAAARRRVPNGAADVVRRARDWGAELMAINVDTAAARLAAAELGADTARGAAYGDPGPLAAAGS